MTQTFLITHARDAAQAGSAGIPCGFLCYRIGANGALQRAAGTGSRSGGLLGILEAPGLAAADPHRLSQSIAAECRRCRDRGVLLDFPLSDGATDAFAALCGALIQQGLSVFVPAPLAAHAPGCRVILPGSLSGGSFEEMLEAYRGRYAAEQICLDLQRCRHSFSMPSPTPDGDRLTHQELQELMQQYQPRVLFSPELCTNYFTYQPDGDTLRFVLFDDANSISQRLHRAAQLHVPNCLLRYSEWGEEARRIRIQKEGAME